MPRAVARSSTFRPDPGHPGHPGHPGGILGANGGGLFMVDIRDITMVCLMVHILSISL